jgi:hypothetical protein
LGNFSFAKGPENSMANDEKFYSIIQQDFQENFAKSLEDPRSFLNSTFGFC